MSTAADGGSVALEEFVKQMIYAGELHGADVASMLRKPGDAPIFPMRRLRFEHLRRGGATPPRRDGRCAACA